MVRTGEIPESEELEEDEDPSDIGFGETVFDEDGRRLGRIRGFDREGFYVTTREGLEALSVQHVRTGGSFGEAELVWRCMECGEVGHIEDELPDTCPNCGTERENLMYWTED